MAAGARAVERLDGADGLPKEAYGDPLKRLDDTA
jgi:hypothetical protein